VLIIRNFEIAPRPIRPSCRKKEAPASTAGFHYGERGPVSREGKGTLWLKKRTWPANLQLHNCCVHRDQKRGEFELVVWKSTLNRSRREETTATMSGLITMPKPLSTTTHGLNSRCNRFNFLRPSYSGPKRHCFLQRTETGRRLRKTADLRRQGPAGGGAGCRSDTPKCAGSTGGGYEKINIVSTAPGRP